MEKARSAVGVAAKIIDGQPRIVVGFYLDAPEVQHATDDNGRPIVCVAFEPEAAYTALADKIIKAYDSLTGEGRAGQI